MEHVLNSSDYMHLAANHDAIIYSSKKIDWNFVWIRKSEKVFATFAAGIFVVAVFAEGKNGHIHILTGFAK